MKASPSHDQATQLKLKSRDAVIHFDEGLFGFAECKDFVMMENDGLTPFRLLQSVDSPEVGFLVLEPTTLIPNYYERIPTREWLSIGFVENAKLLAFVIVVIGSTPEASTGNFQAPLLVNYEKMAGRQIILSDTSFSVRHPLI